MSELGNVIDGIGVVSGILGIISFFQDNLPGSSDPMGATVNVKAGLAQGDDDPSTGGGISHIYGFDANNNYIGESGGGDTGGDGGIFSAVIDQDTPGIQSSYIGIGSTNDAVCMAWVTVNQFDGTPDGWWTGDVGYSCGADWYPSNQIAGQYKEGGDYRPYCTWIDADHTNDIGNAAMKFRTNAYGNSAQDTIDNNQGCAATIYGSDSGPINGATGKRSVAHEKRERKDWMKKRLVTSTWHTHSAREVCEYPNSYGPDFIGADGYFCDMETRTLTPLCSQEEIDGCVEVDATQKQLKQKRSIAKRTVQTTLREYEKVSEWK